MLNPPLLLDACVTISLVAADPVHQIARSVGFRCVITRQAANEVGHLRDTTEGETRVTPVDLADHVQADAFEIVDVAPDEIPLYVELARLVGDGEESTIAVAIKRGMPLATDDRKARRLCAERGLVLPIGTVTLIKRYCEAQALDHVHVLRLIQRITSRASFQVPRGDPDLKWWNDHQPCVSDGGHDGFMSRLAGSARLRAVAQAEDEGHRRVRHGDPEEAIAVYERGCRLAREILADDPADTQCVRYLASMLYALGECQLAVGLLTEAVGSLDEAEGLYKRLGGRAAQLAADTVIRRARVRARLGASLSAIEDVQQAVMASMAWAVQDPASRELDAARVIGIAAFVQLRIGADPDLACAAAHWALMTYEERVAAGGRWGDVPAEHSSAVRSAAFAAAVTHAAAGRSDLAGRARTIATEFGDGPWPDYDAAVAAVRDGHPTLAQVLCAAGRDDLASTITVPFGSAERVLPLVPQMRADTPVLPAIANALADVQAGDLPERARMLLGLEAHAMLAATSRDQVLGMRYQFGDFGRGWARAVLTCGQLMNGQGARPGVLDAIGWLTGICEGLQPFTLVNRGTRELVTECLRWSRDIHAEDGSAEAAAGLTSKLQMLDDLTRAASEAPP